MAGKAKSADRFYTPGVHHMRANHFLSLAAEIAERCTAGQFSPHAQVAQIMAAVAAEAFINELAFLLESLTLTGKADDLCRVGSILCQLEESRVQVTEKFSIASQLLPGLPFDAGIQPFQSFRMLINLRNALVHPKVPENPPSWFSFFVTNKLTVQNPDEEHLIKDWTQQLQNQSCATWACRATSRIVLNLVERLRQPTHDGGVPGVHEMFDGAWSWSRTDNRIWTGSASDGF